MVWNKGLPLGTTPIKNSDQMIRDNNDAIETGLVPFAKLRLDKQALDPSAISDTVQIYSKVENSFTRFFCKEAAGAVIQITEGGAFPLSEISFTPTTSANKGFLYTKEISSKTELFWKDEVGNVLQITSGGSFNLDYASKSDMETATSTTKFVTPGRAQYHPGVAKVWASIRTKGTQAVLGSYNVASITDIGVGRTRIFFTTNFSNTNYCPTSGYNVTTGTAAIMTDPAVFWNFAVNSVDMSISSGVAWDVDRLTTIIMGDQ